MNYGAAAGSVPETRSLLPVMVRDLYCVSTVTVPGCN